MHKLLITIKILIFVRDTYEPFLLAKKGWERKNAELREQVGLLSNQFITKGKQLRESSRKSTDSGEGLVDLYKDLSRQAKAVSTLIDKELPNLIKLYEPVGKLLRDITFAIRAHLIDDIFLERIKALAIADQRIAQTIEQSIKSLEEQHLEEAVSLEDQLANVRLEIKKTLAFLHDKILTLTPKEKGDYNRTLAGLRDQEQQLLEAQEQAAQTDLKKDFEGLEDLLADIPGRLDGATMARKQKLAKLITESVTIEEVSVH